MTTATQRSGRGFTLIEVLVSFFLLLLVVGIGALSLSSLGEKKRLVEPASELKSFARRGLQMAANSRRPFAIGLAEGGFVLREANVRPGDGGPLPDGGEEGAAIDRYELDDGMRLEVRRWGDKHFRVPEDDVWVFEPRGICEPLSIRLLHPAGMIEMEFNPLTAKVSDEALVLGEENVDEYY